MPKYTIRSKLNPHQAEYMEDVKSKFLHLSSGFGGGKSYVLCLKSFQLSQLNKGIVGGCVVPTISDFKKDLLPLYEEILETNRIKYRYHRTDKWFRFPWSKGKMHIATAEKKIRGPNWGWAVANEVTLISHERFKEMIGRVRVKNAQNPQIAMSGTPEGTGHWLHEELIEEPLKNSRIIYGDTRDNLENLSPDYIDTLMDSYDEIMLDAYLRGLFVNMTGSRYYYAYDPKKNDNKEIEQLPNELVYVTLDYNVSPMVSTFWNLIPLFNREGVPLLDSRGHQIKRARAFDQAVIEDGADIYRMMAAWDEYGLEKHSTIIYPDPAGRNRNIAVEGAKSNNQLLKEEGWQVKVKTSAPRHRSRQLGVCNMLAKGYIQVHPTKCKALKKDLEAVEQDKATLEKVKSNPKLTHASDGMDYFIDIEFPFSGKKPESRSVKYR